MQANAQADHATTHEAPDTGVDKVPCDGSCSNGTWFGRGYMLNGTFVGQTGKCFRCGGKGWLSPADMKRNRYYDNHVRRA